MNKFKYSFRAFLLLLFGLLGAQCLQTAAGQATLIKSIDPEGVGRLCGVGLDPVEGDIWVHGCNSLDIRRYTPQGEFVASVLRPGEITNDVDVTFAPAEMAFANSTIPEGTLLFINGEVDEAEIYAIDKTTGEVIDTLQTAFGVSHVVGGGYSVVSGSIFLIQDTIPEGTDENRVAEIDPVTGAVIQTYQIGADYEVNFGDLDVFSPTGNLLVVSNINNTIAAFSPDGELIDLIEIPVEVLPTGVALDCARNEAWMTDREGILWHLGNVPCALSTHIEGTLPASIQISSPYPNPFIDRTTLSVDLAQPEAISITIYDVLGREVTRLHEGTLSASHHQFLWDAGTVKPGVYWLRVAGKTFSKTYQAVRFR